MRSDGALDGVRYHRTGASKRDITRRAPAECLTEGRLASLKYAGSETQSKSRIEVRRCPGWE